MKFEVMGNRVMVEPQDKEAMSPGGVVLPDAMKEKTIRGKVVGVGLGRYTETGEMVKPVAKEGDLVYFAKGAHTTELLVNGTTYLVVRDEDLLGRLLS